MTCIKTKECLRLKPLNKSFFGGGDFLNLPQVLHFRMPHDAFNLFPNNILRREESGCSLVCIFLCFHLLSPCWVQIVCTVRYFQILSTYWLTVNDPASQNHKTRIFWCFKSVFVLLIVVVFLFSYSVIREL